MPLTIGCFDTRENAMATDLSAYDEVFTSGYFVKNDGGSAHYKRYDHLQAFPPMGFDTTASGQQTRWGLIPDGGTVNPLQAGAVGDGVANDRSPLQLCILFVQWWNETTTYEAGPGDEIK